MGLIMRRNLMAGGWKNPYVTDGLVAMWDGVWNSAPGVHDPNATAWNDIVGGRVASTTGVSVYEDHYRTAFNGYIGFSSLPATTDDFTLEVVWNLESIKSYDKRLFYSNNYNNFCINNPNAESVVITDSLSSVRMQISINNADWGKIVSCGMRKSDGISEVFSSLGMIAGAAWTNPSAAIPTYFHAPRNTTTTIPNVDLSVYAFRIYSRALSSSELDLNRAKDVERFGITT